MLLLRDETHLQVELCLNAQYLLNYAERCQTVLTVSQLIGVSLQTGYHVTGV